MFHFKKLAFLFIVVAVVLTACGGGAAPAEAPAAPASDAPFGQAACAPNCTYADMVLCYPQLGA